MQMKKFIVKREGGKNSQIWIHWMTIVNMQQTESIMWDDYPSWTSQISKLDKLNKNEFWCISTAPKEWCKWSCHSLWKPFASYSVLQVVIRLVPPHCFIFHLMLKLIQKYFMTTKYQSAEYWVKRCYIF